MVAITGPDCEKMFPYIELNSKPIYFPSFILWAQTSLVLALGETHSGLGKWRLYPKAFIS